MYSGRSGCIKAKVVVLEQSGVIWEKVVVFGQYWLYSGKVVVIGQKGCIPAKVAVFQQKTLYSGKEVVFGQKW